MAGSGMVGSAYLQLNLQLMFDTRLPAWRAVRRCLQGLLSAHERQEASTADLRQKVRALRQELDAREKALDLARRTVERLTGEKGQLEAGAAGARYAGLHFGCCWGKCRAASGAASGVLVEGCW